MKTLDMKVFLWLQSPVFGMYLHRLFQEISDHANEMDDDHVTKQISEDSPFRDLHANHQRDNGILDDLANRKIRRDLVEVCLLK